MKYGISKKKNEHLLKRKLNSTDTLSDYNIIKVGTCDDRACNIRKNCGEMKTLRI